MVSVVPSMEPGRRQEIFERSMTEVDVDMDIAVEEGEEILPPAPMIGGMPSQVSRMT